MAMPKQLAHVAVLRGWRPGLGKTVFHEQVQKMACIAAVGFLLAHATSTDLGGIADPQLDVQLSQQPLEPSRMSAGFDAYAHVQALRLQLTIKAFGLPIAVLQTLVAAFASLRVVPGYLLAAWVIITAYNQHVRLLPPVSPWRLTTLPSLRGSREPTVSSNQTRDINLRKNCCHFCETGPQL
jgi:hypothetical protein